MKKIFIFPLFCFHITFGYAQELTKIGELDVEIAETSGILILNNRVFTHNDSNGDSFLYELDKASMAIIRKIELSDANNIDWEDITSDETYIYIGDFGNNLGNRKDLKIYKVLIADVLDDKKSHIESEKIEFRFADQKLFNERPFNTDFDAEAMFCLEDSLYLFSKNWSDFKTRLYSIPKSVGNYEVSPIATYNVEGLISGATINKTTNQIVLVGYDEDTAFIIPFNRCNEDLTQCTFQKIPLIPKQGDSSQMEGIDFLGETTLLISAETGVFGKGGMYLLKTKL